jgi:hypothetical protein
MSSPLLRIWTVHGEIVVATTLLAIRRNAHPGSRLSASMRAATCLHPIVRGQGSATKPVAFAMHRSRPPRHKVSVIL